MATTASVVSHAFDRTGLVDWFQRGRARTSRLLDIVPPDSRLARPIPLRHPILFYEGHIPVFNVNTILVKGLGLPGLDPALERLFARGIDPEDEAAAAGRSISAWPTREALEQYVAAADRAVESALRSGDIFRRDSPVLAGGQGVFTGLEHEAMHQETLLYILHQLPYDMKRQPATSPPEMGGDPPAHARVRIPAGPAVLGTDPARAAFGWDNEFPPQYVDVDAFDLDVHDATNADFLSFLEAGGYRDARWWKADDWVWVSGQGVAHPPFWVQREGKWYWRGQFHEVPLPAAWPVYVTHAEASAYARWRDGRLLTEAEYDRAAFGAPGGGRRPYPWGDAAPDATRGNFDFNRWDPAPVGSYPAGVSAWGVHDLVGNGWEWTSTVFGPFPGFAPMASYPEYSADFFDEQHYVLKGASPVTARELLRPGFRNWFRPQYPYIYANVRVAYDV